MKLVDRMMAYEPFNEQEVTDKETMLNYLHTLPELYDRNCIGHITCSPWIINAENTKVLMVYHNLYDSWGWCGGHSDGEHDLLSTALREGKEETGLLHLEALSDAIFSLEVLPVNAHHKHDKFVSAHMHLNFTFLCVANEEEDIHCKPDENSDVRWIAIEDIKTYVSEEAMLPVYQKLVEKSQWFLHRK